MSWISPTCPEACFTKFPKLFGPISVATIPFISSERRAAKPSNFAVLLVFRTLKACSKISFSKQVDCSLTPQLAFRARKVLGFFEKQALDCKPQTKAAFISFQDNLLRRQGVQVKTRYPPNLDKIHRKHIVHFLKESGWVASSWRLNMRLPLLSFTPYNDMNEAYNITRKIFM